MDHWRSVRVNTDRKGCIGWHNGATPYRKIPITLSLVSQFTPSEKDCHAGQIKTYTIQIRRIRHNTYKRLYWGLKYHKNNYMSMFPGWRPRRSIVFCSWGAEEYALIGSREWVEVRNWVNREYFKPFGGKRFRRYPQEEKMRENEAGSWLAAGSWSSSVILTKG